MNAQRAACRFIGFVALWTASTSTYSAAPNERAIDPEKAKVIQHWTSERRANALPRDLVIDPRGLGYQRHRDGYLAPHGHDIAALGLRSQRPSPFPFAAPGDAAPVSSTTIANAHWDSGGEVVFASGRLYFEMPGNTRRKVWWGYVCSGTVATDGTSGRSIILTAAHCVYDDVHKAFARNVMFIPDQDGTTGSATDRNCNNDPIGCWVAAWGVVDKNWTLRKFPDNVAWDYGFYVVSDTGAHQGTGFSALDLAAGSLDVKFGLPAVNDGNAGTSSPDFTYGLGYSYSDDPNLMYCAEDMTAEGSVNWWLPSCLLGGGSSGGPWVQSMSLSTGSGEIVSVNSWGYTNSPGMAGPKLAGTSAACIFGASKTASIPVIKPADGAAGTAVTCP